MELLNSAGSVGPGLRRQSGVVFHFKIRAFLELLHNFLCASQTQTLAESRHFYVVEVVEVNRKTINAQTQNDTWQLLHTHTKNNFRW